MTDDRRSNRAGDSTTANSRLSKKPGWQGAVRSIAEILVSGVIIIPLLPFFAAIAIAIRIDSPGPILFRQRRIGLNGKIITVHKFRTMSARDLDFDVAQQAIRQDPRITRVGRVLRQTSLDELPQLFDVLSGNLALIGPRPILTYEMERFRHEGISKLLEERLTYKPGITGMAQVNGLRSATSNINSFEQMVEMDVKYMRERTLLSDLKVILLTVTSTLTRHNAY